MEIQPGILDERAPGFMALADRFDAIPIENLLVYLIDHVHASALPHLVEQFDMGDFIRETTSEATTRAMLKSAIDLKRKLGTEWAVKFVADTLGLPIEFIDWHRADPQLPRHTFVARAYANDARVVMDGEHQAELIRLIRVAKRGSQHETVEMAAAMDWSLGLAAGAAPGQRVDAQETADGRDGVGLDIGIAGAAASGVRLDAGLAAAGRDTAEATLGMAGAVAATNTTDVTESVRGRDHVIADMALAGAIAPVQVVMVWS
jgi:phage tail P2-like protein